MMRRKDLRRFNQLMNQLEDRQGQKYSLMTSENALKKMGEGVYFLFEPGESCSASGNRSRIVKVGSNLVDSPYPSDTLWKRLRQHRGTIAGVFTGGGDHRQSVLRYYVGTALINRDGLRCDSWGVGARANTSTRQAEHNLESRVSQVIRKMPVLCVEIPARTGQDGLKEYIVKNSIGLLSNFNRRAWDPPSDTWLGHHCSNVLVGESGLWNANHVMAAYEPAFLDVLEELIGKTSIPVLSR